MATTNDRELKRVADSPVNSDSETTGPVVNERSLLRRLDRKLLPAVGLLYLLSFLDRSNVGNARIEGLLTDLHMTGNQYLNGLTLYFVGYVLFEIPCNIALKRTSPKIWLPTLTIAWGIVATLLGIVQNTGGFYAARFFLGVTESGLFPGVVFYFSMWYKRRERQYRVSMFFSAASLAGAFGGALAYGIGRMRGIVWENGWHWIFILEGIVTVLVAAASYGFVYNYPSNSKFLSEDERTFIHQRLAADSDATHDEVFTWDAVWQAFRDPKCWLYGLGFHTMSLPLYTLSLFLVGSLLNEEIWYIAFAFATTVAVAILSERLGQRAIFIGGSALFAAIGYSMLLGNTDPVARPGVSYAAIFFAAGGIYPATALVLSWPAINVSGQTKRAIANAMQISIGNCGAVIGTQLYRSNDGPRFVVGHSVALGYLLANVIVVTILGLMLKKENKRRQGIAEETKDVGVLTDWRGDEDPRWRFEY
ncbi:Uu.00g055590.m01.CDS01 [Anthostomella pinea]|uniref:Uu.00g055590.m01.CDS01 n=1 Tax=Anthostomella pinea TaxID=933095 RepID=A0AAI8YPM0_9PEZI|nr:Uu.00g055590.m01.CDS01 [Anthostomella pinea]